MNRSPRNNTALAVCGVLGVAVAVFLVRTPAPPPAMPAVAGPGTPLAATAAATPAVIPASSVPTPLALSADDHAFLTQLREKFGKRIANKHAQIKLLEQLIAYLQAHYPADWAQRLHGFLQQLFPELADALFAQFERLQRHNAWLASNRDALRKLPPAERRAALWAARREAFGADAAEIWAPQLLGEQLADAMARIDADAGLGTEQKLAGYVEALHATYGEQAPALLETRPTELMNRFLDLDSVQEDLRGMAPMQRSATLRTIRAGMGLDEAALQRWDELDRVRDESWDRGQQYLEERGRIALAYEGAEEQQRIAQLQRRLFGEEADVIRSEEAAGFQRFARPRRIGRE